MSPDDPRHGTNAGYQVHLKEGSEPCQPCRQGKAATERARRARKSRPSRFICVSCLHQKARRSGGICRTCSDEVVLTGGRWVLDPVRRIQVWEVSDVA